MSTYRDREKRLAALEARAERFSALPEISALDVWGFLFFWRPIVYFLGGRWGLCEASYPVAKRYEPVTADLARLGYTFNAQTLHAHCDFLNRRGVRLVDVIAELDDLEILDTATVLLINDAAHFDAPGHLSEVRGGADAAAFAPFVERFNTLCAGQTYVPILPEEMRPALDALRAGYTIFGWEHHVYVSQHAPANNEEVRQCVASINAVSRALHQQIGLRFQTIDEIADWFAARIAEREEVNAQL